MTKQDIEEKLYAELTDLTKRQCHDLIDFVFDKMKSTLAEGEDVKISGFGKWVVKSKNDRIGRNPKTGEPMTIVGRRVVSFKLSQILRDKVDRQNLPSTESTSQ